jgi:hypothetical protein
MAYYHGDLSLHALIKVRLDGELVKTTAGRVIFNEVIPDEIGFINEVIDREIAGSSRRQPLPQVRCYWHRAGS